MPKKTNVIVFKGKNIYFTDYTNLKESADIIKTIDEAENFIKTRNEKDILYLIDISGSVGSLEVISRYKNFSKLIKPLVRKDAVIGATMTKEAIINTIRAFSGITMQTFKTKDEALEYLVG